VAPAPYAPPPEFRVVQVDGDGSRRAVVGAPDDVDGVGAVHRVAQRLRVVVAVADEEAEEQERPPPVERAFFTVDDDRIDVEVENREDGVVLVSLPAALPLRRVLALTLVAGAARAEVPVFFLQGEPGPAALVDEVDDDGAVDDACPFGGRVLRFGTDDDGDNDLDEDEVDVRRVDCDEVIRTSRTVAVANEAALRAALTALGERRLAPAAVVTLQLPAGDVAMAAAMAVDHVDGERIVLAGASGATPTRLVFAAGKDGVVVTGGLRLRDVGIASPDVDDQGEPVLAGIGLRVADGGFVVIDAEDAVVVEGFATGVDVASGGVLVVRERVDVVGIVRPLQVRGNRNGATVEDGGVLFAPALVARDNANVGVVATGGEAFVRSADIADNKTAGLVAQFGGYVDAIAAVIEQPGTSGAGISVVHGGVALCNGARISGGQFVVQSFDGAVATCERAALNGPARAAQNAHLAVSDSSGDRFAITVSDVSTAVHRCSDSSDSTAAAACAAVFCTELDSAECLP
jgi:hypothetical protein